MRENKQQVALASVGARDPNPLNLRGPFTDLQEALVAVEFRDRDTPF